MWQSKDIDQHDIIFIINGNFTKIITYLYRWPQHPETDVYDSLTGCGSAVGREVAMDPNDVQIDPLKPEMPGAIARSVAMSLGNQEAPGSILTSGISFMKIWVLIQEEQLSVNGEKMCAKYCVPASWRIAQEQCG